MILSLILFLLKKRNFKNYLFILLCAGAGIAVVMLTDIRSADDYYSGNIVHISPGPLKDLQTQAPHQGNEPSAATAEVPPSLQPGQLPDDTVEESIAGLTEDQQKILRAIRQGFSHVDDIAEETSLTAARTLAQLTVLEIRGFVSREAGRRFSLRGI